MNNKIISIGAICLLLTVILVGFTASAYQDEHAIFGTVKLNDVGVDDASVFLTNQRTNDTSVIEITDNGGKFALSALNLENGLRDGDVLVVEATVTSGGVDYEGSASLITDLNETRQIVTITLTRAGAPAAPGVSFWSNPWVWVAIIAVAAIIIIVVIALVIKYK